MHRNTFDYHQPTDEQITQMAMLREAARVYGEALQRYVPEGADKEHIIRLHRTAAMWANVAVTRLEDGTPRGDAAAVRQEVERR